MEQPSQGGRGGGVALSFWSWLRVSTSNQDHTPVIWCCEYCNSAPNAGNACQFQSCLCGGRAVDGGREGGEGRGALRLASHSSCHLSRRHSRPRQTSRPTRTSWPHHSSVALPHPLGRGATCAFQPAHPEVIIVHKVFYIQLEFFKKELIIIFIFLEFFTPPKIAFASFLL